MKPEFVTYALSQRGREVTQLRDLRAFLVWAVNFQITDVTVTLKPLSSKAKGYMKTITWDDYVSNYEQYNYLQNPTRRFRSRQQ